MDLSDKQIQSYLVSPFHCPCCGAKADSIEWGKEEDAYADRRGPHYCKECDFEWVELVETKVACVEPSFLEDAELEEVIGHPPRFLTMNKQSNLPHTELKEG